MNSDPYDSAAWRTFGMLDADESAIFDEAMRHDPLLRSAHHEMDRLSAAIAAVATQPIEPRAGQLERLQARLHLNPSRRAYLWLGISGWAAAAVLATFLILDRAGITARPAGQAAAVYATSPQPAETGSAPVDPAIPSAPAVPRTNDKDTSSAIAATPEALKEQERKATAKVETKRLVQEIEVLRDNLEKFQHRDRVLFEAVPGMALPIVMRMNPPGVSSDESPDLAKTDERAPITAMLGDALRVMTTSNVGIQQAEPDAIVQADPVVLPDPTMIPEHPTAIPIYDAARDAGTLVVSNLQPAEQGKVYNLWVTTATGAKPIYVGSLPENSASGADSFDFSLGSTMVLPSGFILTKDMLDSPAAPSEANIVLQGPPTPGR
jgi:hypothetical protein